jgi:hypothetical protein
VVEVVFAVLEVVLAVEVVKVVFTCSKFSVPARFFSLENHLRYSLWL